MSESQIDFMEPNPPRSMIMGAEASALRCMERDGLEMVSRKEFVRENGFLSIRYKTRPTGNRAAAYVREAMPDAVDLDGR